MTYEQSKWYRILETDKKSTFAAQCEMTRFLDDVFHDNQMYIIDLLLNECEVQNLSIPLLISILSSTLPAKGYLQYRQDFFERVQAKILNEYTPKESIEILAGLE